MYGGRLQPWVMSGALPPRREGIRARRHEPERGSRDGAGRYGFLDLDATGRLVCHECGRSYVALGVHVALAHEMNARTYRLAHGLGVYEPLATIELSATLAAARPEKADRLAEARDPKRALSMTDQAMVLRGQRVAGPHHPAR